MIFPELKFEKEVVEADKTRLSAENSYISGAEFPITSVNLKVSNYVDEQVYVANKPDHWFVDIKLKFQADIDASNNALRFQENGVDLTATLTNGTYTLAALIAEIAAKMTAAGTLTYALTLDEKQRVTVDWGGGNKVKLLNRLSPLWEHLGFKDTLYFDVVASSKLIGTPVRTLPVKVSCTIVTTQASPGVGTNTETIEDFYTVYSLATVNLFSDDSELAIHEPDVKSYCIKGRNTHKNAHLQAQKDIIEWLDRKGFVNIYDEKFTVNDIYDKTEVSNWAKFRALELIFGGLNNANQDIFKNKEDKYMKLANKARRRIIRIDVEKDGRPYAEDYLLSNTIKFVRT